MISKRAAIELTTSLIFILLVINQITCLQERKKICLAMFGLCATTINIVTFTIMTLNRWNIFNVMLTLIMLSVVLNVVMLSVKMQSVTIQNAFMPIVIKLSSLMLTVVV